MKISVHRKEQWDLECWPLVCVHVHYANSIRRVFCLWFWGIEFIGFDAALRALRKLAKLDSKPAAKRSRARGAR